jgi:peptidoglycan/xylan/chitin deacetylase (PgdA/CDA1 family)
VYSYPFRWPDGAYIALTFDVVWEGWPADLGTPASTQHSTRRPIHANATYQRDMFAIYEHAFAERGGMQRILDLLDRHQVKATVLACGVAVQHFPDIARTLHARGHELSSENWDHKYSVLQTPEEERADNDRTVQAFKDVLGCGPTGYTSSVGLSTPHTLQYVAENGYQWYGDFVNTEMPFVKRVGDRKLVCLPHCLIHDYLCAGPGGWTPRQVAEVWQDEFDALYEEGRRGYPKLLSFALHGYLCRGMRTRPLEDLIAYARSHPKVWFARRIDIANWVLEHYPELTLDDFYPESAQSTTIYGLP